jgi:hypothetical protein
VNFPRDPSDPPHPNPASSVPLGTAPDGRPIASPQDLPVLPAPRRVIVERGFIDIDGWVFPYSSITRALLVWLKQSFERWHQAEPNPENQRWLTAIVSAFEHRLAERRD